MDFDSIIGQEGVLSGLRRNIETDRVGHAYTFTGPVGIGKKSAAKAFAGALLCKNRNGSARCGKCMSCKLYAEGSNPDFRTIEAEDTSIGVDAIRDMQADVVKKPLYSPHKVYLISEAENMTVQAQNCLLKTLEEPPEYAVIILTASRYDALLETLRSRSVRYDFKKNSDEEIEEALRRRFGTDVVNKGSIVSYSDGIIGTALELAGSDSFVSLIDKAVDIVFMCRNSGLYSIFGMYSFFEENKSSVDTIFDIMITVYRDMLVVKETGNEYMLINSDKKDIILSKIQEFSVEKLLDGIRIVENARKNIKQNANFQLSIEVMLMELQEE